MALGPGAVRTPMLQRAMDNDAGLEPYLNSIRSIGRFSEPHEQAQAAVWLLSDAASFVTGSCLAADGGFTAICSFSGAASMPSIKILVNTPRQTEITKQIGKRTGRERGGPYE